MTPSVMRSARRRFRWVGRALGGLGLALLLLVSPQLLQLYAEN